MNLTVGDLYLARLVARRSTRLGIYALLAVCATAAAVSRVGLARSEQALPAWLAWLSLYGAVMAWLSRDLRSRVTYLCFMVLVAAAFSRGILAEHVRAVGALEAVCCLLMLACLRSLSRDGGFVSRGAVLQSDAPETQRIQEDPDD